MKKNIDELVKMQENIMEEIEHLDRIRDQILRGDTLSATINIWFDAEDPFHTGISDDNVLLKVIEVKKQELLYNFHRVSKKILEFK